MGFLTPKTPAPDPALEKARLDQEALNRQEAAENETMRLEKNRKVAANLIGQKSLQDEDLEGFGGYRRPAYTKKTMGRGNYT